MERKNREEQMLEIGLFAWASVSALIFVVL